MATQSLCMELRLTEPLLYKLVMPSGCRRCQLERPVNLNILGLIMLSGRKQDVTDSYELELNKRIPLIEVWIVEGSHRCSSLLRQYILGTTCDKKSFAV